ncbi:hypothetical protein CMV_018221 [Castanea mollissima]|uniref:ALOG domain-containing protein n=1 Tax=Castanea mollissima TaxID=60419 RepID=A0A8J4R0A8_9ROSI|nr:hypothetical protein CMV_018221 [Castanea mollissima]
MDSTSGGAGSSDPNSGEGPSSATAPADQSSSPAPPTRYESQKRRDWNTFGQYLKNQRCASTPAMCSGTHEIKLSRLLYLLAQINVHNTGCPYFGHPNPRASLKQGESSSTGVKRRVLVLVFPTYRGISHAKRSNQGESPRSGGRADEERNGGGGDGNQGIGGGAGGGGHREGIGNERRGSRGRSHGGGNGDDDDNDRGGRVGYIEDGRRPMGPRQDRMAEILIPLNFEIFATVESIEITGLSVRVRIVRVVSLGFISVALVCLSASIRQRRANPRLASILSWIGSVATFLGFISMIAMALLASFIP